jgi:hypothetical protein
MLAQDIITLKTGDEIEALVQEIGVDVVKYKRYGNTQGPSYSILKTDIFMIRYENGAKDTFGPQPKPATAPRREVEESRTAPSQAPVRPVAAVQGSDNMSPSQPAPAKKDRKVRFGIQAGVVLANMNSVDYKSGGYWGNWDVSPKFGFTGGVSLDIRLSKLLSLQPELLFTMKGCFREGYTDLEDPSSGAVVIQDAYNEESLNMSYLEMPLLLIFNIPVKKDHFNIGLGPYVAYGIAGKSNNHFSYNNENIDEYMLDSALEYKLFTGGKKRYKPLDYGVTGFVGFTFSNGMLIKAGYSHGLANMSVDTKYLEEDVTHYYFHLSVGMAF